MADFMPPDDKRGWTISVLVDTPDSWIRPWAKRLVDTIAPYHDATLCNSHDEIMDGDLCFLLGCLTVLSEETLGRNRLNLAVHESDLPQGRGWSPVAWQVAEGRNTLPVCLFEAVKDVDSGPVYLRDAIELDGTELLGEIREKQGARTVEMCLEFLTQWPDLPGVEQAGEPTYYPRRTAAHDEIDPNRTLAELFDQLRIKDNENYPAWFTHRGRKYRLKIEADED